MTSNESPTYYDYLQLEKILSAQRPLTASAHDEMLFIIIHQTYELWFKQIIHELDSILMVFGEEKIAEKSIGLAVHRLKRVIEIEKILLEQISILETMTPLDFLDFRSALGSASGFQSAQFRRVEVKLGLRDSERHLYDGEPFYRKLAEADREMVMADMKKPSLFDLLDKWLARNPFSEALWMKLREAILVLTKEQHYALTMADFDSFFGDASVGQERRLSNAAARSALLIMLYRDESIFHLPFRLLESLLDVDELFSMWRYRHALMVQRFIGSKTGTGGSSGYQYLLETSMRHKVFQEIASLSSFLIPRRDLPALPSELRKQLSFHWDVESFDR